MSRYLLDTNTISQFVKKKASAHAFERLNHSDASQICVSIVSRAEVLFGLVRAANPPKLSATVEAFFQTVEILDWDEGTAQACAKLRSATESEGMGMGALDLMIAAQAMAAGATLVTNDGALKRLTPWLPVEDWTL
ncbi:MAG TPA: PIN domain-containing protein [Asticcacaulis sp.]|nr:PIN domain-containing protein [Asticcacaulis sp.]